MNKPYKPVEPIKPSDRTFIRELEAATYSSVTPKEFDALLERAIDRFRDCGYEDFSIDGEWGLKEITTDSFNDCLNLFFSGGTISWKNNKYDEELKRYQSSIKDYQKRFAKYEADLKKYEEEKAELDRREKANKKRQLQKEINALNKKLEELNG